MICMVCGSRTGVAKITKDFYLDGEKISTKPVTTSICPNCGKEFSFLTISQIGDEIKISTVE